MFFFFFLRRRRESSSTERFTLSCLREVVAQMPLIDDTSNVVIGSIGSACILLAYILITFSSGWTFLPAHLQCNTRGTSIHYQLLNLVGGVLAAASAFLTENKGVFPLAVLETIWAIIAIVGLVQIARSGAACSKKSEAVPHE